MIAMLSQMTTPSWSSTRHLSFRMRVLWIFATAAVAAGDIDDLDRDLVDGVQFAKQGDDTCRARAGGVKER